MPEPPAVTCGPSAFATCEDSGAVGCDCAQIGTAAPTTRAAARQKCSRCAPFSSSTQPKLPKRTLPFARCALRLSGRKTGALEGTGDKISLSARFLPLPKKPSRRRTHRGRRSSSLHANRSPEFGAVCRCDDNCCARRVPREGGQRLQRVAAASLSPRARNAERSPTHFP